MECDNSYLSKVCRNNKEFLGYKWAFVGNEYIKKDYSAKPVCQIDLKTGAVLKTFSSISEAAKSVNGDMSYISKVCRGIQHSSKGYGWKYLDDK